MSHTCQFSHLATAIVAGFCIQASAVGQDARAELSADCSAYASVPLPEEAQKTPVPKTSPACASYRSYRGIGRPIDFLQARACAWQERLAQQADLPQNPKEPAAWIVGGSLILADIYFNGARVKRNVPLAMRFACESEEAMAHLAVKEIARLKGPPDVRDPFEFCDYAATTITMNFCFGYRSAIEDDRRNRFYNSLKPTMTPQERAAFQILLVARQEYVKEHRLEVDQGGTIRGIRTIGSQNILEDLFRTELILFERKKWPVLSEKEIAAADAALAREYDRKLEKLRSKTKDEIEEGGVTAENLSRVQGSWVKYRDAWVAFAGLRYPSQASLVRAEVTRARHRLLKTIY